jgi:hypothetical protein
MIGEDDQSTDASVNNQPAPNRNDFTFMGNEDTSVFEQISKFTSVEQYREFLEKELGDDKLMSAYPILKDFVIFFSLILIREINFCSLRRPLSWRPF